MIRCNWFMLSYVLFSCSMSKKSTKLIFKTVGYHSNLSYDFVKP